MKARDALSLDARAIAPRDDEGLRADRDLGREGGDVRGWRRSRSPASSQIATPMDFAEVAGREAPTTPHVAD